MKRKSIVLIMSFLTSLFSFSQINESTSKRLDKFVEENSTISYKEIDAEPISKVLKHKVYFITLTTRNMYNATESDQDEFIVIDLGDKVKRFELDNTNKDMPELQSYIKEDFILDDKSASMFQGLLDLIYPIDEWESEHKEYFKKDGKWYFLRDEFFSSKEGFEITIDPNGKITSIRYKMEWEQP